MESDSPISNQEDPSSQPQEDKRKNLFIHPKFQRVFLTYSFFVTFLSAAIFYVMNLIVFTIYESRGTEAGFPKDHVYFHMIREQMGTLNWSFLITLVVLGGATWIHGLYMSNRIAGPIYRLKQYFENYHDKEGPIQFREDDYFSDIADSINNFLKKIGKL